MSHQNQPSSTRDRPMGNTDEQRREPTVQLAHNPAASGLMDSIVISDDDTDDEPEEQLQEHQVKEIMAGAQRTLDHNRKYYKRPPPGFKFTEDFGPDYEQVGPNSEFKVVYHRYSGRDVPRFRGDAHAEYLRQKRDLKSKNESTQNVRKPLSAPDDFDTRPRREVQIGVLWRPESQRTDVIIGAEQHQYFAGAPAQAEDRPDDGYNTRVRYRVNCNSQCPSIVIELQWQTSAGEGNTQTHIARVAIGASHFGAIGDSDRTSFDRRAMDEDNLIWVDDVHEVLTISQHIYGQPFLTRLRDQEGLAILAFNLIAEPRIELPNGFTRDDLKALYDSPDNYKNAAPALVILAEIMYSDFCPVRLYRIIARTERKVQIPAGTNKQGNPTQTRTITVPQTDLLLLRSAFTYARKVFKLAQVHGNWSHYNLIRPDKDLTSVEFPWAEIAAPRHLTTLYSLGNVDGQMCFVPEQWVELNSHGNFFPTSEDTVIFTMLSVARQQMWQARETEKLLHDLGDSFMATFQPTFASQNTDAVIYHVSMQLFVEQSGRRGNLGTLENPPAGSHMKIILKPQGHKKKEIVFNGQVTYHQIDNNAKQDLAVFTTGIVRTNSAWKPEAGTSYYVALEFPVDDVASIRELTAIKNCFRSNETERIDAAAFLFGAVPRNMTKRRLIDMLRESNDLDTYYGVLNIFNLNKAQKSAALGFISSGTGVELLWGPPGTGKTMVMMATICACSRVGLKVSVTAPSNTAVVRIVKALRKLRLPHPQTGELMGVEQLFYVSAVHFVSASLQQMRQHAAKFKEEDGDRLEAIDTAREVSLRLSNLFESDQHAGREWGVNFKLWKMLLSLSAKGSPPHPQKAVAVDIVKQLRMLWPRGKVVPLTGSERYEVLNKLQGLEDSFMQFMLREQTNVLFTTCSTAQHELVLESFQNDLSIIDECGQATTGEIAEVFDTGGKRTKVFILAGDHKQLGPTTVSQTANECLDAMRTTAFSRQITAAAASQDSSKYKVHTLYEQYRCHPGIAALENHVIYEGKLETPDSVRHRSNDATRDLKAFLAPIDHIWDASAGILAVNVNGASNTEGKTKSLHNHAESEAVESFMRGLAARFPASVSRCGVMTPYKAQVKDIKMCCKRGDTILEKDIVETHRGNMAAINHALSQLTPLKLQDIRTVTGCQGEEFDYAILSTVNNNVKEGPFALGISRDARLICVQISRGRQILVWFGNWTNWMKGFYTNDKHLNRNDLKTFRKVLDFFDSDRDKDGLPKIVEYADLARCLGLGQQRGKVARSSYLMNIDDVLRQRRQSRLEQGRGRGDYKRRLKRSNAEMHGSGSLG